MPEILPSVRFQADDPRPVGFVADVTSEHLEAAARALRDVAETISEVSSGHEAVLTIRFSSVRWAPGQPFVLYGFHVTPISESGGFIDAVSSGEEVVYAVVCNHDVEVQRETAVLFLYDILFRQVAIADMRRPDGPPIGEIDSLVAAADAASHQEFADRIRVGWQHATRAVAQRAIAAGLTLAVRYQVDVLPTRAEVVRRIPVLRRVYNEIASAREAVDNMVAMVGGRDPRITTVGVPVAIEDKLQRHLSSLSIRQWITQTTRDAQVCGNGFLVISESPEPTLYNLKPEDVEIAENEEFRVIRNGVSQPVEGRVAHIKGIEQFESPYGMSILEPVLNHFQSVLVMADAVRTAEQFGTARDVPQYAHHWAEQTRELAARMDAARSEFLSALLQYPRDQLPKAREGLYFPGQERM